MSVTARNISITLVAGPVWNKYQHDDNIYTALIMDNNYHFQEHINHSVPCDKTDLEKWEEDNNKM